MRWGLLGPEQLAGLRRTRTLGLGAAVRRFNSLAVPGLGGVWFAKQLFLATLGVRIADQLREKKPNVKAIEIANAVEALACWCAFSHNKWKRDPRLRGIQKLHGKDELSFLQLRSSRFYVTQPMRMATVEALVHLGLVEPGGLRFNSFFCSRSGVDLIETATKYLRPHNSTIDGFIVNYAIQDETSIPITPKLRQALSPLEPLAAEARALIKDRICERAGQDASAARRKNALKWVSAINPGDASGWDAKPFHIEQDHWDDLRVGAKFFKCQREAVALLNAIENRMAALEVRVFRTRDKPSISYVEPQIEALREASQSFLDEKKDPTDGEMATDFCRECAGSDAATTIRNLVKRDEWVLRLAGDDVLPGPAFSPHDQADASEGTGEDADVDAGRFPVPPEISGRIRNLYLLHLDLEGRLDAFLDPSASAALA
jgi:hypothetical protein